MKDRGRGVTTTSGIFDHPVPTIDRPSRPLGRSYRPSEFEFDRSENVLMGITILAFISAVGTNIAGEHLGLTHRQELWVMLGEMGVATCSLLLLIAHVALHPPRE